MWHRAEDPAVGANPVFDLLSRPPARATNGGPHFVADSGLRLALAASPRVTNGGPHFVAKSGLGLALAASRPRYKRGTPFRGEIRSSASWRRRVQKRGQWVTHASVSRYVRDVILQKQVGRLLSSQRAACALAASAFPDELLNMLRSHARS